MREGDLLSGLVFPAPHFFEGVAAQLERLPGFHFSSQPVRRSDGLVTEFRYSLWTVSQRVSGHA